VSLSLASHTQTHTHGEGKLAPGAGVATYLLASRATGEEEEEDGSPSSGCHASPDANAG